MLFCFLYLPLFPFHIPPLSLSIFPLTTPSYIPLLFTFSFDYTTLSKATKVLGFRLLGSFKESETREDENEERGKGERLKGEDDEDGELGELGGAAVQLQRSASRLFSFVKRGGQQAGLHTRRRACV